MGDFERVKEAAALKDFADEHLEHVGRGLVCPICGSGTGRNRTPAFSVKGDMWKCFKCDAGGDVFDLAGAVWGIPDKRGQLEAVADWAGVTLEAARSAEEAPRKPLEAARIQRGEARANHETAQDFAQARREETAYIERAQAAIGDPEALAYLAARGFSEADARAAGLGYDSGRRRLVVPWRGCGWYHVDRAISDEAQPKYMKPKSDRVGRQPLYNPEAVKQPAYFVVEGALDAVAVQLCGHEAIALGSNSLSERNLSELAAAIVSQGARGVAVLMLDNDEAGRDGAGRVGAALAAAGVACVAAETPDDAPKDAAEWRRCDPEGFGAFLAAQSAQAAQRAEQAREDAYRAALGSLRVLDPADVAMGIYAQEGFEEPTPTGIAALDDVLDGGLRSGLYALGAISSMGKTTLALQVADYIAEHGRGVLFVTIEQSARELAAKSLSRYVRTLSAGGFDTVSATEAVSADRRARWGEGQNAAFLAACEHYAANVAPRLRILEGTAQPGVKDVEAVARMMAAHDGGAPVVLIDYLQLMRASDGRITDRRLAVDDIVRGLRQLARDMKAPVLVISSLKREAYSEGVTMDSWKESGGVEYSCDVLMGLQPRGLREVVDAARDARQKRDAEKAMRRHKAGEERECELVILKNRSGRTPDEGIPLTFSPVASLYTEGWREGVQPAYLRL